MVVHTLGGGPLYLSYVRSGRTLEGTVLRAIASPTARLHVGSDQAPRTCRSDGRTPILVGGGERVTSRVAAQHADVWNGFGPPAQWQRKNAVLDGWCRRRGRAPAAVERTVTVGRYGVHEVDAFLAAGATHFVYGLGAPHGMARIERLVAWRDIVDAEATGPHAGSGPEGGRSSRRARRGAGRARGRPGAAPPD